MSKSCRERIPVVVGVASWLIPGAGHFLVGQVRKGAIFFGVLFAMFVIGLAFGGRLFPFQMSEPLVFLAAAAEWAIALPRIGAAILDQGHGNVGSRSRTSTATRFSS
jgi:TM2 domain-containing membrane protein YozV